jgi:hypothetical protein
MLRRRFLALLALLLVVIGCGNPFPPRTLVERLRVLGIRADPADADLQSTVTFKALVADPTGKGRTLSTTWAVCAPGIDYGTFATDCPSATSYPLLPGDPLPSGELTGETTAKLVMPDLMAWVKQQGYTIDTSITQVVDIWIGFVVSASGEEVHALKRLPVHIFPATSVPDESTYNHNPTMEDFEGLNLGVTIPLKLGDSKTYKPKVNQDSFETFTPEGETASRREDLVFIWFSTYGEFDYARTILAADNQNANLDQNVWSIPKSLASDQSPDGFLWVVVRDGRFGTDWKFYKTHVQKE